MPDYVDLRRIAELQGVMGQDVEGIVGPMLRSMTTGIEDLQTALAEGRLDRATQAAHACRNDALMLGAKPLQAVLTELEAATRDLDVPRATAGLERLKEVWPPTREQLAQAARPPEPP
jgi:HPt (histidine-containing phosphotransfer) domain-containing protein